MSLIYKIYYNKIDIRDETKQTVKIINNTQHMICALGLLSCCRIHKEEAPWHAHGTMHFGHNWYELLLQIMNLTLLDLRIRASAVCLQKPSTAGGQNHFICSSGGFEASGM